MNNPSKNPDVQKKQSDAAKRRIAEGERSFAGWNKGLSKESDERLAEQGRRHSKGYWTEEKRSEQAFRVSQQWKEGRIHANKMFAKKG